ncbi:MAG: PIG-L family deacetylase [Chloroflexi bacterium]|nr:MAG: PIG-L family deacetylase [Chloroflexota bacterium]
MKNKWIYLSPHFDDAVLSCGGLAWEQVQAGEKVEIWTICAGEPPNQEYSAFARSLHERWETGLNAAAQRREEDTLSCAIIGASARTFSIPDCIYRMRKDGSRPICDSEDELFQGPQVDDKELVCWLANEIGGAAGENTKIVSPLALGNHVDHWLTRTAAEQSGGKLWYYADYPYVLKDFAIADPSDNGEWKTVIFPVSEGGLEAWMKSIAAHRSQLSTFWDDVPSMEAAIREYYQSAGGIKLWMKG